MGDNFTKKEFATIFSSLGSIFSALISLFFVIVMAEISIVMINDKIFYMIFTALFAFIKINENNMKMNGVNKTLNE